MPEVDEGVVHIDVEDLLVLGRFGHGTYYRAPGWIAEIRTPGAALVGRGKQSVDGLPQASSSDAPGMWRISWPDMVVYATFES